MILRRSALSVAAWICCTALACSSCSTTNDAPADVGDAQIDGCEALATAYCARLDGCAPAVVFRAFGDTETCRKRVVLDCGSAIGAAGAHLQRSGLENCAEAVTTMACTDLFTGLHPSACAKPEGERISGAGCSYAAQCRSSCLRTSVSVDRWCGRCDPEPTEPECDAVAPHEFQLVKPIDVPGLSRGTDRSGCPQGLVCSGEKRCVEGAAQGAACSDTEPCLRPLVCDGGTCKKLGARAAPCGLGMVACNVYEGLWCASGRCVDIRKADEGQPCPADLGGNIPLCARSSTCVEGTCVPTKPDGAACVMGSDCLWPAVCLPDGPSGTTRKCVVAACST
ncbi:MAG: hypothetical protein HYV09_01100 [Deltaproteobacteria bacterium]|nr:hypothetical protein [Deltaproteobacteria bacterium]